MRRAAANFLLPIAVDRESASPMYRQLYEWFRGAILNGHLRPGQRVPSSRSLAIELKISRIPVLNAFEQLHAEGYLESIVGSGTCVARSIPDDASKPRSEADASILRKGKRKISRTGASLASQPKQVWLKNLGAFRVSLPALDHFPIDTWSRLVARHSRMESREKMAYGDAMGHVPLREAIADYIGAVRGVRCDATQVMIVTGSQQALQLCALVLLNAEDRVWVEEPGYPGAHQALAMGGARLVPVPVDEEGLQVREGIRRCRGARVAYVTPSHQYPMGMTMSASRRLLLLDWAVKSGAWIVEDDYDSEYRFGVHPIAALQGLDRDARVIYIGTFSKVLFPALRIAYVVLPKDLVASFSAAREAADIFSSTLYQAVLTDFIREGHFARHIRRMRMLYMERRSALITAIEEQIGGGLEVVSAEAGMHLVGLLRRGIDDAVISAKAAKAGISAEPLSMCYLRKALSTRGGLILGYGGTDVEQIRVGVKKLAGVIGVG